MRAYNVSLNLSKRHFFFSNPCVQKSLCMYLYIYPSDSLPSIDTLSHSKIHPLPITRVAMATFMLFWRSSTGRKLNFLGSCDMPKKKKKINQKASTINLSNRVWYFVWYLSF